ncbi:MAG: VWA domain-containing protein [Bacteroidota bacterium]|nr:VWA domain-containing protein [Bacteroidota bacterium]MDP4212804.1 VWA domain-containing protein [Bacteroidota bacterium]MDP4250220.1 VWA domain-containing protein [Bacteroidota bacterium]
MNFENPEYLIALLLIPGLVFFFIRLIRWKKTVSGRIGDPQLVNQLVKSFSARNFLIKFVLIALVILLLITGMANPRARGASENVTRQGVDVMIVLDVSKSMLATDVKPSRLDKAKQLLYRLVDRLANDRLGLILFAGRSYMQMPLTPDHGAAKLYISEASPNAVPTQGTVFAEALQMANNSFNRNEHKYKAVVLISDGEDHDPEGVKTAKQLAESGVMINTVGIGSPEGSIIIDPETHEPKKDEKGNIVISRLNEPELQGISDASNGIYIRLDNLEDATITLSQRLDGIEKRALTENEFVNYKNYFPWFIAVALILLVIELYLPERKRMIHHKTKPA